MTEFEIAVAGEQAQLLSSRGQLTYRMAGAQVHFSFDGEWKDLTPHALIRQGDAAVAVPIENNTASIPGHALTMVGDFVYAGVYGVSADGLVAIPTVWVRLGRLRDGAHIFYDEDALPNTPIWQTIGAQLGDISRLQTREKANLVDAVNSLAVTATADAPGLVQVGQGLTVDERGVLRAEPGLPVVFSTVLTENTSAVVITEDASGKPFSLSRMTMDAYFPVVPGAVPTAVFYVNDGVPGSMLFQYHDDTSSKQAVHIEGDADCGFTWGLTKIQGQYNYSVRVCDMPMGMPFTEFNIKTFSDTARIPAGTVIVIRGC